MKKTCVQKSSAFLFSIVLMLIFAMPAYADIGPKKSVEVKFSGAGDEPYYATLLSETPSTGPTSVWDGQAEPTDRYTKEEKEIWRRFVEYEDADGFYFLQTFWECSNTDSFRWGYFPPEKFKILVYFPQQDKFVISPVYSQYAFDSYYRADLSDVSNGVFTATENYNYTWELISLLCRIVLTILIELAVALCFGYKRKTQISLFLWTNIATQIFLNTVLNIINYKNGPWAFIAWFVLLELIVFAIEAVIYAVKLPQMNPKDESRKKAVGYAFTANLVSCLLGFVISKLVPGIF